jgi:hypothetical protein
LLLAILPSEDDDIVDRGERGGATCESDRLHDVQGTAERKVAGVVHAAHDVDAVSPDQFHRHGDDRIGDIALQPLHQDGADLLDSLADSVDIARERKREATVRPDEHFALQLGLFPDGNRHNVAGLHAIGREVLPGRLHADLRLLGLTYIHEHGGQQCEQEPL